MRTPVSERRSLGKRSAYATPHCARALCSLASAATSYFELLAMDNQLQIARRTLFTREENLKKAKLRFEGGLTNETVYRQAQVEYATTAAAIPELVSRIEARKNAISLLMGRYPEQEISTSHARVALRSYSWSEVLFLP